MRRLTAAVLRWPVVVIAVWIAVAVALPLATPNISDMAQKHPLAMLPGNAPSSVAAREMAEGFQETGTDDLLLVVLSDENGLGPDHERTYRKLVEALRADSEHVVMVQDFVATPSLRSFLTSKDGKSWVVPVGVAGVLGTPQAYAAFTRVSGIVADTTAGGPLQVHLAGPAATVADLTVAGERDRLPIEIAIAVLVLLVLLVVYRNPVTMLVPLIGIGMSLVIAQAVVAGLSDATGFAVSNQAIILLSAMIAGAGTDYAVFLISRYHDYVRRGEGSDEAVRRALASVGKVITASAATVGLTFLAISFARMGVFATVGVSSAIGVSVALLAALTLLPAILVIVGRRGWISAAPGTHRPVLAALGNPDRAPAAGQPGRQSADSDVARRQCGAGPVQLRLPRRCFTLGSEFGWICGAGTAFRPQPVRPLLRPGAVAGQPADPGGTGGPRADGRAHQSAARHRPGQRHHATARGGAAGVPCHLSGRPGRRTAQRRRGDDRREHGRISTGSPRERTRSPRRSPRRTGSRSIVPGGPASRAWSKPSAPSQFQYSGDQLVANVEVGAKLVNAINELGNSMGVNSTRRPGTRSAGWARCWRRCTATWCATSPRPAAKPAANFQSLVDARNSGTIERINDLAGQLKSLQDQQLSAQPSPSSAHRLREPHDGDADHGARHARPARSAP